jgi:Zn finger protein HypA/HybF involved in hydrogenase expression
MHEFSRVYPLFENVKRVAKGKKVSKVTIATDGKVEDDEVREIFEALWKGTNIQGAELVFKKGEGFYIENIEVE